MGAAGRELAEQKYGIEKVIEAHLKIYQELKEAARRGNWGIGFCWTGCDNRTVVAPARRPRCASFTGQDGARFACTTRLFPLVITM